MSEKKFQLQFAKTRLCAFLQAGTCSKGSACTFAHYPEELRPFPDLTRTSICPNLSHGVCRKPNCRYAHSYQDLRATPQFHATDMCIFFLRGDCRSGSTCRYSHDLLRREDGILGLPPLADSRNFYTPNMPAFEDKMISSLLQDISKLFDTNF